MLKLILAAGALACVLAGPAAATASWRPCRPLELLSTIWRRAAPPISRTFSPVCAIKVQMHRVRRRADDLLRRGAGAASAGTIVAHPAGYPQRAFCGCGAAVRVFGRPVRTLWLAAAWLRFPRAQPAPGMVAVRRHHVFVLEQHIEGRVWLAFDANSGHHATRIHPRSIAGFAIVDPRGAG